MTETTLADVDRVRRLQGDMCIDAAEESLAQGGSVDRARRLYYLLEPSVQRDRCVAQTCQLILSVIVGHTDDRRELGTERFIPRTGPDDTLPPCVGDDDKPIVQRLRAMPGGGHYLLQGAEGAAIVQQCLNTGRCHFGDFSRGPLIAAGDRSLTVEWTLCRDGRQQLQPGLSPATLVALAVEPPLYIDPAAGTCGGLRWPGELATLRALSARPLLLPENVPAINRMLLEQPTAGDIPLAVDWPVMPTALTDLRARLSLAAPGAEAAAGLQYRINGIALCDPVPQGTQARVRYIEGGAVRQVERDVSAEAAMRRELEALAFTTAKKAQGAGEPGCWLALPDDKAWLNFMLLQLPALERAGWEVEIGESFPYRLATTGNWYGEVAQHSGTAASDWFSLELGVLVDGERVDLLPLLSALLSGAGQGDGCGPGLNAECVADHWLLPLPGGRFLPVARHRIDAILDTLVELFESAHPREVRRLTLPANQAGRIAQLEAQVFSSPDSCLHWGDSQNLRELAGKLAQFEGLAVTPVPPGLHATLRPYQQAGLDWLQFLADYGLGGILADDMGLGKTLQVLAHLVTEQSRGRLERPALVVAPTSVLPNWHREARRFAPGLKVLVLHGAKRGRQFAGIGQADLVLTTYPLLGQDAEVLLAQQYSLLVLDEAQAVKNPRSRAARLVRELQAAHRLCLTGTPMENHLGDLWALFDFLIPGYLGSARQFQRWYRTPIERELNGARSAALARRIAPLFLRRTKEEVAPELPPKTEIMHRIPLGPEQQGLYESIRLTMHEQMRRVIADRGLARSQIAVLDALLKLRQVCCDPRLLPLEAARGVTDSAKLEVLLHMLTEMAEEGRRILLFSQFTSMLALIERAVDARGIACVKLTGASRDRAALVERFQSGAVPLFLISLKAGGTGLNLTAADTVIHYDPWWNPAVEAQATDRAYRIGQDKPVFVYKLCIEGSVEEKILALQEHKQALADGILSVGSSSGGGLTQQDLEVLFEPLTSMR